MADLDYAKDLEINKDDLEMEWLRQPGLFMQYAEVAAEAEAEYARLKENLAVVEAGIAHTIRQAPEKWGLLKCTDSAIESICHINKDRIAAFQKQSEAKMNWELAKAAVKAFEQRCVALEQLNYRYLRGMNSTPRTTAETERRVTSRAQAEVEALAERKLNPEPRPRKKTYGGE